MCCFGKIFDPVKRKSIISVVCVLNRFLQLIHHGIMAAFYRLVTPLILSSKTVTAFMLSFSSFFSLFVLICLYVGETNFFMSSPLSELGCKLEL
jgi:hypothetical protein